jgi:F-box and WD-40 domain protein 1/11
MSPRENSSGLSVRRRPSLSLRPRSKTATHSTALPKEHTQHQWQDASLAEVLDDYNALTVDDTELFPEAVPRRRAAKSFSSLRHPMDGLVALGRRLSVSVRNKSSKQTLRVPELEDDSECSCESGYYHHVASHGSNHKRNNGPGSWAPRSRDWSNGISINRRPSLNSVSALQSFYAPTSSVPVPIPGNGLAPPVLPNDKFSGSAARAAAAAQNEAARLESAKTERDLQKYDTRVTQDSESGIGIDLRDHSCQSDWTCVRNDPVSYLPAEISAHIFSYLDPASLMDSESVSKAWHRQASSPHVWKHVFRGAYPRRPVSSTASKKKQSVGLGKPIPNQDWKKMFLVRRSLEQRWKQGKAAAIYLHGHTDSVYCAQFDEDKIITGSRDRTIRVWDAHYPWSCQKIIGPPTGDVTIDGPVNNPAQQATGMSPFATICPPSTPSAGIVTPMEHPSDYHSASVLCLKFDEEIMVTGSSDFSCIVWDIKNDYRPIHRLTGHSAGVLDVCFDDRYIVSCSKDTSICVWDRKTGVLLKQLSGHGGPVNAVQLRGDLVVSASGDGVAKLWNIVTGHCVKEFLSKDRGLACVEFSDDGRTILTGGNDKIIYQFDANTGELVREIRAHSSLIRSLHLDSMNKRIVSGSYDMSVKVFDADTGELSIDLPGWTTSWMLNVQSDYRRILATSQDSRAVIMDFGYGLDGIELLEE